MHSVRTAAKQYNQYLIAKQSVTNRNGSNRWVTSMQQVQSIAEITIKQSPSDAASKTLGGSSHPKAGGTRTVGAEFEPVAGRGPLRRPAPSEALEHRDA